MMYQVCMLQERLVILLTFILLSARYDVMMAWTSPHFSNSGQMVSYNLLPSSSALFHSVSNKNQEVIVGGFIDNELRGAAMKLHTRSQAPREGEAPEQKPKVEYVTTQSDYLAFLVDSQAVFHALENAVHARASLEPFRNTGLERVKSLETDIDFLVKEYDLKRPKIGKAGMEYAQVIEKAIEDNHIPEFMCHFYNFYFAHTAGGRMIGKQMSSLLLDNKVLEFYKWDGNVNKIKDQVKNNFEIMASEWSSDDKEQCVNATAAAFQGGGGVNANLIGGM